MSCFIKEIKQLLNNFEEEEDKEAIDVLIEELEEYINDLKEEIRALKGDR